MIKGLSAAILMYFGVKFVDWMYLVSPFYPYFLGNFYTLNGMKFGIFAIQLL